ATEPICCTGTVATSSATLTHGWRSRTTAITAIAATIGIKRGETSELASAAAAVAAPTTRGSRRTGEGRATRATDVDINLRRVPPYGSSRSSQPVLRPAQLPAASQAGAGPSRCPVAVDRDHPAEPA